MDNLSQRGAIQYLVLKGLSPKKIHEELVNTLGKDAPSYTMVKKWSALFKAGKMGVEDHKRSGRPKEASTHFHIEKVKTMVMSDRRITIQTIADSLGMSQERVHSIIHKNLKMSKVSARWVPRLLTDQMKDARLTMSRHNLSIFEADPDGFLKRFVTMDETWVHHHTPECKKMSMQWKHASSPTPTKAKVLKSAGKVMLSVFWDSEGVLLVDFLKKGNTINAKYYSNLLIKLRAKIKELRPGKLSKTVMFHQDNAPAHTARDTMSTIAECGFEIMDHPPYSPDLAPSDYYLFPQLKKKLMGRRFRCDDDVIRATTEFFGAQNKEFYKTGILKLYERWNKCVNLMGGYVEK